MCKKVLITDMDDTLIRAYGNPTDVIKNCWNTLSDEEIIRIVATGQSVAKTMTNFSKNDMNLPEYIIADQGTVIYNTTNNSVIKEFTLPNEEVSDVLKHFLKILKTSNTTPKIIPMIIK